MQLESDWEFYVENVRKWLESFKNYVSSSCIYSLGLESGMERGMKGKNVYYSI